MDRRGLLATGVFLLGGAIAGGLSWLGAVFVRATSRWPVRSARKWAAIARLSELQAGQPVAASFEFERIEGWYRERVTRQVYVTRDEQGRPVVLSRRCTHLGCPVTWKAGSGTFKCACHGGVFDPQGRVIRGPPERGLDVLEHRIAGEMIEVEQA